MTNPPNFKSFRSEFHLPKDLKNGQTLRYFCGNSLGLQPKKTAQYLQEELDDWANLGVEGHTEARRPWKDYHEQFSLGLSQLVGAKPQEVVATGTLTANLHLLMVSFFRPQGKRCKILIEKNAFPSDQYAVASQLRFHGLDPAECLIEWSAPQGQVLPQIEDLKQILEAQGQEIALMLIGGVNYYTGQVFDLKNIAELAKNQGITLGYDLAHGVGNIELKLHEWGVDFAAWCHYKYLNSGPGSIAGLFVHEKHHQSDLPRFEGWWGHDKASRFKMPDQFLPIASAEAWQLSNIPVLSIAPLLASLELFEAAGGMATLRPQGLALSGYLRDWLESELPQGRINLLTPKADAARGCQLSLQVPGGNKSLFQALSQKGVIADWREPDVIRIAPVPLYNTVEDVEAFGKIMYELLS